MDFLQNLQPKKQNETPNPQDMLTPRPKTTDEMSLDEIFQRDLPDSLFMNHYELHGNYPHHSAEAWRRYLKENDRFILQEVAAITEANARNALQRLGSGLLKQGDATAITQLLNRSEQINQSVKDKTVYMTTFMPDPLALQSNRPKGIAEQVKENKEVVNIFYPRQVLQLRMSRGELVENADGTAHFPKEDAITHLDNVYMHFHNPTNSLVSELTDGDLDWQ